MPLTWAWRSAVLLEVDEEAPRVFRSELGRRLSEVLRKAANVSNVRLLGVTGIVSDAKVLDHPLAQLGHLMFLPEFVAGWIPG